ncbi:MAG: hypothetical protein GY914_12085 [Prochlorococcus sp.]|nr:hypothetical protein [Prochlorococcus sp.]
MSEIAKFRTIYIGAAVLLIVTIFLVGCVEVGGSSSDIDLDNTSTSSAEQPAAESSE